MKAVIRNTGLSAAAAMLDRGSMVVMTALLSRTLAPDAFRAFGQFQLILTMLAAFSGIGISVSAARLFAEHNEGRPTNLSLVGTMWVLSLGAAIMLGLVATIVDMPVRIPANGQDVPDIALVAGVVILAGGIVANGGMLGLSLFRQSVLVAGAAAILTVGGGWLAARQGSAAGAAWALVAAYAVTTFLSSAMVLSRVGWQRVFVTPLVTKASLKGVSGLIGPLAGVTLLAASGNWMLGQMLLRWSPSPQAFSGFIIGLQWYALVQFLPSMLTRAVFPTLVRHGGGHGHRQLLLRSMGVSIGIALIVALTIVASGPIIASAYHPGAVQDGWVLAAFAFAALPQSAANLMGNAIIVQGGQRAWFCLTVVWFLVLTASATVFSQWNAIGAAASLFLGGMMLTLASWLYAVRRHIV